MKISVIAALAAVLMLAACGGAPAADENLQAVEVADQSDTDVIALVNGQPIQRQAYDQMLRRRAAEVEVADATALENFVITTLINQELTAQAAESMGITVTDAELDEEIEIMKAIGGDSDDAWQAWLDENMYTEESLREDLRTNLVAQRVRDAVVGDTPQQTTRQVHARHILVSTEAEALSIRQELMNGVSFVDLAAQHSRDVTTRTEGGDLGWFAREELLEPRVAETAFSQPEGAISQPVATRLGYHIIETLQFDDLPLPPEKQAQVGQVIFDEWMATQNDSAIIEIYNS